MRSYPDVAEVVAVARALGMTLGAEEAALYRDRVVDRLATLEAFARSRVREDPPPRFAGRRDPGRRPAPAEDPLNAWAWKCAIEGAPDGILAGRTVSVKDHVAIAGLPLTVGSPALEGFTPDFDATIITRVLEAGGTIVGKNVLDGLGGGLGFGGGIGDYARPLNPHAPAHLAGGSSSGSAVAVAAGEVDIAFGGDQAGSIRCPAALCGVLGLKPTFGLVSHFGIVFHSDQSIDHAGPMTRTVEDAAAALQATAGYDAYDPRQDRSVPLALDVMSELDDGVAGLRIGVLEEGFEGADGDVRDLVLTAVDALLAAGARVSTVSVPEHRTASGAHMALRTEGARALFDVGIWGTFAKTYYPSALIAAVDRVPVDSLSPFARLSLIVSEFSRRRYHGALYAKAQNARVEVARAYDAALAEVDVLVMPTCLMTAPRYEAPATPFEALEVHLSQTLIEPYARNTWPFSFVGLPALAVPVGKAGGLPVSMQLVGRAFADPLLLRVAYAYQHSVDWDAIMRVG